MLGKYGADAHFPYENVILCCKSLTYRFDYESGALPLSYCGKFFEKAISALERTRTAMPYGTTPSRWRVYQFHHQGNPNA